MSAPIDSILRLLQTQGATELRIGSGKIPRMFHHGSQKRLTMPEMGHEEVRLLLGDILSPEREMELKAGKRVELAYDTAALGSFNVVLVPRTDGSGLDAVFQSVSARKGAPSAPSIAAERPPPSGSMPAVPVAEPVVPAPPVVAAVAADASPPLETPSINVSNALIRVVALAAEIRATDIHVRTDDIVRVRVDGRLKALDSEPPADVERLLEGCISRQQKARIDRGQSVDLAFEVPGAGRVRANVFRTSEGLAAALRILPGFPPPLGTLGHPMPLDDIVDLPNGLVIFCGPTGSGKSTTLAALAQELLRKRSIALVTLEDPIEYALSPPSSASLVRQRQIGRDVKDFATGLRDALREDPDVIIVGEMRDEESISLALTAAETGHLVVTSLHSRSASSAVERIIDTYPAERQSQIRVQLAEALKVVVAQRLLPKAKGSGRIVAAEVLRGTHAVATAIREAKTAQIPSIIQSSRREGMLPLERSLADLVRSGQITIEAARAVANEPASLDQYSR